MRLLAKAMMCSCIRSFPAPSTLRKARSSRHNIHSWIRASDAWNFQQGLNNKRLCMTTSVEVWCQKQPPAQRALSAALTSRVCCPATCLVCLRDFCKYRCCAIEKARMIHETRSLRFDLLWSIPTVTPVTENYQQVITKRSLVDPCVRRASYP